MWGSMPSNAVFQTEDQSTSVKQWKDFQQVCTWESEFILKKGLEYSLAIVGVCKEPKKTVGLGDSISAAGLSFHAFGNRHVE